MDSGTPIGLFYLFILVLPVLVCIRRARMGKAPFVRRIPGISAIDEAVGRAVELGRPISFTSGLAGVGPVFYACLGVLKHVARKAALFRSQIFVPAYDPETLPLIDSILQGAYRSERRLSAYDPSTIRFLSNEQFAFASGYMGLVHREQIGAAFLFGSYAAESLILAEAGTQVGAMQVAATTSPEQVPFFITSCDYTLIGEELFAAGAYLSGDSVQRGSLRGQDLAKLLMLAIIVIGCLQATLAGGDSPTSIQLWIEKDWGALLGG